VEPSVVAIALLVLLVGGSIALLSRQRAMPWSLPALRTTSGGIDARKELEASQRSSVAVAEPVWGADRMAGETAEHSTALHPVAALQRDERSRDPEPLSVDIAPAVSTMLAERLDRVEASLATLQREAERQSAAIARLGSEARAAADAEAERRAASLERLRSDLITTFGVLASDRPGAGRERRVEVTADLYARLARLESALAAVTNPILLPGEGYEPPVELPTEALIWENWNEVGERAFALADAYSAQRLHLSGETSAELGGFVTSLRVLLTRSVYPNLQAHPDGAQQSALHAALEEIAAELPKVRAALDREYQDERTA
jgi:hypothetical protein